MTTEQIIEKYFEMAMGSITTHTMRISFAVNLSKNSKQPVKTGRIYDIFDRVEKAFYNHYK